MLICDSISWNGPLPTNLRALSLDMRSQIPDDDEPMLQLFKTLRTLTALEYFGLKTDCVPPLSELFATLNECALSHLALSFCKLEGLPLSCRFPASLEIVNIAFNPDLDLEEWLRRLSALPRLRALDIHSSSEKLRGSGGGGAAIFSESKFASALESLCWDSDEDMDRLTQTRAALGLARLAHIANDAALLQEIWDGYRAILDTPPICYGSCAMLPSPQLDVESTANST